MDNQHRRIRGYKELEQKQINVINQVKEKGNEICELIDAIEEHLDVDKRWINIGKTDLQKGLMAIIRSITKPDSF